MINTIQVIKLIISKVLKIDILEITNDKSIKNYLEINDKLVAVELEELLKDEFDLKDIDILSLSVKELSNMLKYDTFGIVINSYINDMMKINMNNFINKQDLIIFYSNMNYENSEICNQIINLLINIKDEKFLDINSIYKYIKKTLINNENEIDEKYYKFTKESTFSYLENELGKEYILGVEPIFNKDKIIKMENYWNYARLFLVQLKENDMLPLYKYIINRSDESLYKMANYLGKNSPYISSFLSRIKESINLESKYTFINKPVGPNTMINDKGVINYKEVPRSDHTNYKSYYKTISSSIRIKYADVNKISD